ncbi:hypothetical protein ACFE04_005094 [Oxalis oulophora]
MVNTEDSSSARAINKCGFTRDQALAWDLFTPYQRFLIVAVIGVAVAESKKNGVIQQLQKSVELRDHVLSSMQGKLDKLCEELYNANANVKDVMMVESGNKRNSFDKIAELPWTEPFGSDKVQFVDCGCWLCDQHHDLSCDLKGNSTLKGSSGGEEILRYKLNSDVEPEERRMSDLSDWASSATSFAEIQMNSFVTEQDLCNLKKENEEKDATINELTTILRSSNVAGSKRIAELEDIIRRKSSTITRLKKDMMVLDQKLVQFTRDRRPSSTSGSTLAHSMDTWQRPLMLDNLVYDMDSTTSPSSSDSDSTPNNKPQIPAFKAGVQLGNSISTRNKKPPTPPKYSSIPLTPPNEQVTSRPVSPLTEISANRPPLRQKQLLANGEHKSSRRRTQSANKRWV